MQTSQSSTSLRARQMISCSTIVWLQQLKPRRTSASVFGFPAFLAFTSLMHAKKPLVDRRNGGGGGSLEAIRSAQAGGRFAIKVLICARRKVVILWTRDANSAEGGGSLISGGVFVCFSMQARPASGLP